MTTSRFLSVIKAGLKVGLVGTVIFILIEVLLFVFEPQVFRNSFYVFDPDLGFRVRPYAVYGADRANRDGFNDRDYAEERKPGSCRILFLGDSFNWMGGQAENYTAVLESLFESRFGAGRVEVISAGYSMTHTGEQLALFQKLGVRYRPDLVVLGVYAGNDFYDAVPDRRRIVYAGVPIDVFPDREIFTVVLGRPFLLRSRLLTFIEGFAEYQRGLQKHGADVMPQNPRRSDATLTGYPEVLGQPSPRKPAPFPEPSPEYVRSLEYRFEFCDPRRNGQFRPNIDYIERSIRELEALLNNHQIRLMLSVFPDQVQVDEPLRIYLAASEGRDIASYDWNRPQELLSALCARERIDCFDLTGEFRAAHDRGWRLYLPNDPHWNRDGNRLAAELFYSRLEGWVESFLGGIREAQGPFESASEGSVGQ